ncbi:hypothetical protein TGARI_281650 [Toxoplasma gondii ARI]|uniref:Uncharacterized protein n=1 Tax=Toxoplasma gondii ARI TaxID=1074872 RepID=A0A139XYW8_TOXGO|nr:hypothetical protein TGARI_281650 [Toxoplasma gondii ARI]
MDEEVVSSVMEEESEQTSLASSDDEGDEAFARDLDAEMSALLSQLQPPAKHITKSLAPGLPKKAGLPLHARKKLPALVPPKSMAVLGVKAKTPSLSLPQAAGAGSSELSQTDTASPASMHTPQDSPKAEGTEEKHEREDESRPDATLQKKAFPRPPSVKPTLEKSPSLFPRPPKLGGPADSKSKAIPKPTVEHRPAPSAPLRMPPKATAEPQPSAGPMTQSPVSVKFPRPAKAPAQEKAEHAKKVVLPKQFGGTLGAKTEAPKKTAAASKSSLPPQSLFPRPPALLSESSPLASQPSSPLSTSSPFPESPAYRGSPPHPPAAPHAAASPHPSAFPHPGSPPQLRAPLPDFVSHPNAPKETGTWAEGAVWETRLDHADGDSDEGRGRRDSTTTSESVEEARRREGRAIPGSLARVAHKKLANRPLATETEAVGGPSPRPSREAGDRRNAHRLDVDDECRQFAAHILDEAEADAEVTATAEVSGDVTGEIWLDEILESESDNDLDPLDHRWGMLLSDPRWELQRMQPRYQYTPVVQASYVASCPFGTSVGVRAPPYRSLYRRPKNYVVGVSYLRHYELPTVSRLLKAPAPEFLRKRPWTKHPEGFKGMPVGGGLHFEIDLCGGKPRRAGREERNVSQRCWKETRRSSRANRDAAWFA